MTIHFEYIYDVMNDKVVTGIYSQYHLFLPLWDQTFKLVGNNKYKKLTQKQKKDTFSKPLPLDFSPQMVNNEQCMQQT